MPTPSNLREDMYRVFTPGSPINERDFFKGRVKQLQRILDTLPSPGRHPIVFGQRGVGKTSLVNILSRILTDHISVQITCDDTDTFKSIWNRIFQKVTITFKQKGYGFSREEAEQKTSLAAFLGKDNGVTSAEVAEILGMLKSNAIFIIDEFDRIADDTVKSNIANLIKNLSDNSRHATIVLVGVGESITDLIGKHPSIERNLVQIEIPLMSEVEIEEIVLKGGERLGLTIRPEVVSEVTFLAGGFPHYAHLLGLSICKACLIRDVDTVDAKVFEELVCSLAVEDAIETNRLAFAKATRTSRDSRYPQILCACGVALCDEQGVFRATDVVEAMKSLFQVDLPVQAIVPALQAFTEEARGAILVKIPFGTTSHYQLREPMMRPLLRIKGRCLEDA